MDVTFSVNRYDSDGDINDKCILLHLDDKIIIRVDDIRELRDMIKSLEKCEKEIKENYGL